MSFILSMGMLFEICSERKNQPTNQNTSVYESLCSKERRMCFYPLHKVFFSKTFFFRKHFAKHTFRCSYTSPRMAISSEMTLKEWTVCMWSGCFIAHKTWKPNPNKQKNPSQNKQIQNKNIKKSKEQEEQMLKWFIFAILTQLQDYFAVISLIQSTTAKVWAT